MCASFYRYAPLWHCGSGSSRQPAAYTVRVALEERKGGRRRPLRLSVPLLLILSDKKVLTTAGNGGVTKPVFSFKNTFKKVIQYSSHRILQYVHEALNIDEKKLIAQFGWKSRDERFELN